MCRGSTHGETYLVRVDDMPNRDRLAPRDWIAAHGGIPVDACIGPQVERLIRAGVRTVGSCCGHGREPAHVLIRAESLPLVQAMGYTPQEYTPEHTAAGIYRVSLR